MWELQNSGHVGEGAERPTHPVSLSKPQRACLSCRVTQRWDWVPWYLVLVHGPVFPQILQEVKINTLYGIYRLFSFAVLVCLLINLSSSGLTLEKLRNHVFRCYGGFVKVTKLWDLASGCCSTPSSTSPEGLFPPYTVPGRGPSQWSQLILSQTLMSRGMPWDLVKMHILILLFWMEPANLHF